VSVVPSPRARVIVVPLIVIAFAAEDSACAELVATFPPKAEVTVEAYDESSLIAAANSLRVSKAPGAPPIKSVISVCT